MQSGDLVFCDSSGAFARLIRWAQRHDNDGPDSIWNHVAVLDEYIGGNWTVIQANPRGITSNGTLADIAPGGKYEVVSLPPSVARDKFLTFLYAQEGKKYGWLTIVSCAISALIPKFPQFRSVDTYICSGLVSHGLTYAGFAGEVPRSRFNGTGGVYWQTPAQVLLVASQGN